jgi:periplasmic protein TonB
MKSIIMQTNNILSAKLIDIVFDGRNKAYGAYELRNTYEKRIGRALLITVLIAGLAVGGTALANSFKKNGNNYRMGPEVTLESLPEQKKQEKLPEPEREKPREQEPVKTEKVTEFVPVKDNEVETPPPTQDDIAKAKISDFTQDGIEDPGTPDAPGPENVGGNTGIVEPPVKESDDPLAFVEVDAKFTGNWRVFLERNLNADVPIENEAPVGRYSVVIRFVVDKQGVVSDITALTNHGYGMEAEAIRVIKKSVKWEPAFQNGQHVKAYRKQVIVFEVMGE